MQLQGMQLPQSNNESMTICLCLHTTACYRYTHPDHVLTKHNWQPHRLEKDRSHTYIHINLYAGYPIHQIIMIIDAVPLLHFQITVQLWSNIIIFFVHRLNRSLQFSRFEKKQLWQFYILKVINIRSY